MTKAGITYSTLWSEDFTDEFFLSGLRRWLAGETVKHDVSHVRALSEFRLPAKAEELGAGWRTNCNAGKAIMGIFDEGCMGMYNAIIPDELLHADGRVQGAAEPVGAVCRDAAGERCAKARRCGRGWTRRA